MKQRTQDLDFAQIGTVFNEVTTALIGGVTERNSQLVMKDLQTIQTGLDSLLAKHPEQFQGEAAVHAQNVADQLNLEMQAVKSIGTDPYAAKYINDVQRDLIDIVQGDDQLAALATRHGANGFGAVPDLLAPPAPFPGNAEQTAFMRQFASDAVTLGDRAVNLVEQGAAPTGGETQQLVQDIAAYVNNSNAFTLAQGGLYSARFNNEFALDGVNGTASRALIQGLQAGNADEVKAAANVLAANAADVAGNMLGIGQTPVPTGNGIPAHIDTFAQAGAVFNDATTRLIGGVYDGTQNDGNRQSILTDLNATRTGLSDLISAQPDQFQGATGKHVEQVVSLLGKEIGAVQAAGSGAHGADQINNIHRSIVAIVQNDTALKALSTDGDNVGFSALPQGPANGSQHVASVPHSGSQGSPHDPAGGQHGNESGGHHTDFAHLWG
jgi:hypothetical protein